MEQTKKKNKNSFKINNLLCSVMTEQSGTDGTENFVLHLLHLLHHRASSSSENYHEKIAIKKMRTKKKPTEVGYLLTPVNLFDNGQCVA